MIKKPTKKNKLKSWNAYRRGYFKSLYVEEWFTTDCGFPFKRDMLSVDGVIPTVGDTFVFVE